MSVVDGKAAGVVGPHNISTRWRTRRHTHVKDVVLRVPAPTVCTAHGEVVAMRRTTLRSDGATIRGKSPDLQHHADLVSSRTPTGAMSIAVARRARHVVIP